MRGCSLVNNAQLCFLIGGLFLLLGSPREVRRLDLKKKKKRKVPKLSPCAAVQIKTEMII